MKRKDGGPFQAETLNLKLHLVRCVKATDWSVSFLVKQQCDVNHINAMSQIPSRV